MMGVGAGILELVCVRGHLIKPEVAPFTHLPLHDSA